MGDNEKVTYWEDLDAYQMDEETIRRTIDEADGCVVCWTTKDGGPSAAYVSHAVLDGDVYVTMTKGRAKTVAWRRDPRMAAVFDVPGRAVTIRGRIELDDDPALSRRFLEALAMKMTPGDTPEAGMFRDIFLRHMDSPKRVTGRIIPEKYLTFDAASLPMD